MDTVGVEMEGGKMNLDSLDTEKQAIRNARKAVLRGRGRPEMEKDALDSIERGCVADYSYSWSQELKQQPQTVQEDIRKRLALAEKLGRASRLSSKLV